MRLSLIVLIIFCSLKAFCQEDYVMRLNDTLINVVLDKPYNIDLKGTKFRFIVSSKDTLTYSSSFFSFLYPKTFKVTDTKVENGIEQASILSPEGSGLIIQKYETMNPTTLNELFLSELTKESISYGFISKRTTYKRKLKSGQEVEITRATLRYKEEVNVYEVASIGKKDAGLMILTISLGEGKFPEGQKVIDLMWNSLAVK